jgi:hypothetical protein
MDVCGHHENDKRLQYGKKTSWCEWLIRVQKNNSYQNSVCWNHALTIEEVFHWFDSEVSGNAGAG